MIVLSNGGIGGLLVVSERARTYSRLSFYGVLILKIAELCGSFQQTTRITAHSQPATLSSTILFNLDVALSHLVIHLLHPLTLVLVSPPLLMPPWLHNLIYHMYVYKKQHL